MEKSGKTLFADGSECWFKDGVLHREDGPAYTSKCGGEIWYYKGERHRLGGPAITWEDGTHEWYIRGKKVDPLVAFVFGIEASR